MTKTMVELNDNQRKVVNFDDGQLLVVAGAGTGKTRVIVERIIKLINDGADPSSILAVTFTHKAANEMIDRVNEARGGYALDMTISTFNSFGAEVLESYATEIGLGSHLKVLGETGQIVFLRTHLDELELDYFAPVASPDAQLKAIAGHISELKQQLVTPEAYQKFAAALPNSSDEEKLEKQKHTELARVYKTYIDLCRQHHVIDYDDQVYLTIELLEKRPNIAHELRERYRYIMVDEFQDTNPMQSRLIDLINGEDGNLMVVGDDDQSIYGWRGATLANILEFTKRYPKAKQISLTVNYRSTQAILDSTYRLIQNNNPNRLEHLNKIDKRLKAANGKGVNPEVVSFSNLDSELHWIAGDIEKHIKAGGDPSQIAVLARRSVTIKKAAELLSAYGIDFHLAGITEDLYRQPAVAAMIEILKAVHDPHDSLALYHTLSSPLFDIDPMELAGLSAEARAEHIELHKFLESTDHQAILDALQLISDWRRHSGNSSIGELAYAILDSSGWKDKLYRLAENDAAAARSVKNLGEFFTTLREFERITVRPSLAGYIENLPSLEAAGNTVEDDSLDLGTSSVQVMTIHKAKGLEWDRVYIVDLTEDSLPMRARYGSLAIPDKLRTVSEADSHINEERRLLYVAMTRARQSLTLTHSLTHNGTTKRRPSRFLSELPDKGEGSVNSDTHGASIKDIESFSVGEHAVVSLPARMRSGENIVLSVSQIGDFLRCPYDFYYRHVLNVPQPPNPVTEYGSIVHKFIEDVHKALMRDELPPFEKLVENITWPSIGYQSAKQRERAHKQGYRTLQNLYERLQNEPVPEDVERRFRVHIPSSRLILTGRIDAVYNKDGKIDVTDYKTGTKADTPEKAKSRATGSKQLGLYALAWRLMNGTMPDKLSLDFVETGQKGSVSKRAATIDKLEQSLAEIPDKIDARDYNLGANHDYCRHPVDL